VSASPRPRCPVDVDLADPDTFASGMPWAVFARLREQAPVAWHPQDGAPGGGFWAVTRAAEVREVSRQPEVFSSWRHGSLLHTREQDDEDGLAVLRLLLLNMDPPQHTALRRVVQRAFTPRTVRALEPRLRAFAEGVADRALAAGGGDFVADVAAELPLLTICELLGVPAEDRRRVYDLSNRLIGFDDPRYRDGAEDGRAASAEMYLYADELAERRRREPRDDVVTELLHAEVDGEALTVAEFDVFFLLLAVAGNETTRNAITHGMLAFFDHPDQWDVFVRERPATAADEIIRWASPVTVFQRTATRDVVLGGQPIAAGDRVAVFYPAANRDPGALPDPDRFDVRREPNDHLAFGGGGPHFCLGAPLARAEVRIMFETIADRMPGIRPAGEPSRLRSALVHGITSLPVRYRP
jgi:cholest-4-en-3-one 26-monooxygenase